MLTAGIILLISLTRLSGQNTIQDMDSVSYSLGVLVAQNLKSQGMGALNANSFAKAVEDVMQGRDLQIEPTQANAIVQTYMQKKQEAQYETVIKTGEEFLTKNAEREEVTQLPSGLQYEVLKAGEGEVPSAQSTVTVHYEGKLLDGTVFDSSYKRGEPATFGVTQVIAGWTEALQRMPVGSKWKLYVPAELAYGPRGAGGKIGPYETLIFEVELLGIQ